MHDATVHAVVEMDRDAHTDDKGVSNTGGSNGEEAVIEIEAVGAEGRRAPGQGNRTRRSGGREADRSARCGVGGVGRSAATQRCRRQAVGRCVARRQEATRTSRDQAPSDGNEGNREEDIADGEGQRPKDVGRIEWSKGRGVEHRDKQREASQKGRADAQARIRPEACLNQGSFSTQGIVDEEEVGDAQEGVHAQAGNVSREAGFGCRRLERDARLGRQAPDSQAEHSAAHDEAVGNESPATFGRGRQEHAARLVLRRDFRVGRGPDREPAERRRPQPAATARSSSA